MVNVVLEKVDTINGGLGNSKPEKVENYILRYELGNKWYGSAYQVSKGELFDEKQMLKVLFKRVLMSLK